jgi:ParB-like chromosome segregation protein Spo0J
VQIDIAAITIGNRHRRDMGDIEGLAVWIKDIGLLQPICVRPDGTLIAGARRFARSRRRTRRALAAIFGEVSEQVVHGRVLCRVDH